ncbi:MAG: hypothetical protein IJL71_00690 [Oscillospiraceae bacterium]|nr:hypothetical protein [Oscillospiraceae bacterium]
MKKTIALLLALCCLTAILAGCSKSDPIGKIREEQAAETAETDAGKEAAPAKEEAPAEEPEPEPEPEAEPYEFGAVNGDTYENRYFGFGFKGEDWTFEAENFAEENGITEDLTDEELREVYANAVVLYDLSAENEDGSSNIYMSVENLVSTDSVSLSENDQADLYEKEFEDSIRDMGGENIVLTRGLSHIGEDIHPCINMEYDYKNLHFYQKEVFIKGNEYLACISITSLDAEGPDQIMEMFYKL